MEHDSQWQHRTEHMGHARAVFVFSQRNDGYPETKSRQVIYGKLSRMETDGKSEKEFNEPFFNQVHGYNWSPAVTVNDHVQNYRAPLHQVQLVQAFNAYHGYIMTGELLHRYPQDLGNSAEFIEGLSETLLCFYFFTTKAEILQLMAIVERLLETT